MQPLCTRLSDVQPHNLVTWKFYNCEVIMHVTLVGIKPLSPRQSHALLVCMQLRPVV